MKSDTLLSIILDFFFLKHLGLSQKRFLSILSGLGFSFYTGKCSQKEGNNKKDKSIFLGGGKLYR